METDVDLPPIGTHGARVALLIWGVENLPEFLHDPDLRVRPPVLLNI